MPSKCLNDKIERKNCCGVYVQTGGKFDEGFLTHFEGYFKMKQNYQIAYYI